MSKSQRDKGLNYERKIAAAFREIFPDAARHLEFQAHEAIKGCDVTAGPFVIQCKNTAKFVPAKTLFDVQADEGKIPLLVCRDGRRGCPDLVVMKLLDLELCTKSYTIPHGTKSNPTTYPALLFAFKFVEFLKKRYCNPVVTLKNNKSEVVLAVMLFSDFLAALKAEHPETVATMSTGRGYPSAVSCMGRAK